VRTSRRLYNWPMFLLIDKPKGMTSHDVVNRVRRVVGERKVGHGGTLDPNATGLLIVGVGRAATKRLGEIAQKTKKSYEAEIILGEERDTDDVEGRIVKKNEKEKPSKNNVEAVLKELTGEIEQIPPTFSAIKMDGKKAYELARKGKEVKMEVRKVTVYKSELADYQYPVLRVVFEVSSGTYIRALARDIGRKLGCGAYLVNLRRTQIGKFKIVQAVSLEGLDKDNWKRYTVNEL